MKNVSHKNLKGIESNSKRIFFINKYIENT